jgi:hypothetical protein
MEQIKLNSLKFALDFSMQLNQTNPSKDYNYVIIEKDDNNVTITEDTAYPIEKEDYNMLMFVDSQLRDAPIKPLEKWKKLLDRLAELDGLVFITIQYRPIPKDSKHEGNK